MDIQLSIGMASNPRTWAIHDGRIKPDGIELIPSPVHASELFWRQLKFGDFDVSEMSFSSLIMAMAAGDDRWVGLPVFTTRRFFHTGVLIRKDSGIQSPADLKGKRVGVPEYQQTAALWTRGVLQHEFGVEPKDMEFFMERVPEQSHGGATGFKPPKGVNPADLLIKYNDLMNGNPPPVGAVHDDVLLRQVAGWRLSADISVPTGPGPHPVLVYFHGGGWTMGSPKTHLRLGREFAAAGYLTVNVDYRRAPKHRFPAAFDDCLFATQWAVEHAAEYGGDAQRLAVGGDSAGANLAGGVLAECSRKRGPAIKAGLLLYGVFDYHAALAGLGTPHAKQQLYLPVEDYEALREDHRVSPLYACDGFPPCYIAVGTKDPLLAESHALAEKLSVLVSSGRSRSNEM